MSTLQTWAMNACLCSMNSLLVLGGPIKWWFFVHIVMLFTECQYTSISCVEKLYFIYIGCLWEEDKTVKMSDQELAELRACGAAECGYKVPNGVKDIDHILKALNNQGCRFYCDYRAKLTCNLCYRWPEGDNPSDLSILAWQPRYPPFLTAPP